MVSPRIMKTHDQWEWVPKGEGVRYVCCYRNPKDVAVSYYHHLKNWGLAHKYEATFDEYMADVFLPKVGVFFGYYFDHVAGWLRQSHKPNVLILTYEDMVEDLRRE